MQEIVNLKFRHNSFFLSYEDFEYVLDDEISFKILNDISWKILYNFKNWKIQ